MTKEAEGVRTHRLRSAFRARSLAQLLLCRSTMRAAPASSTTMGAEGEEAKDGERESAQMERTGNNGVGKFLRLRAKIERNLA